MYKGGVYNKSNTTMTQINSANLTLSFRNAIVELNKLKKPSLAILNKVHRQLTYLRAKSQQWTKVTTSAHHNRQQSKVYDIASSVPSSFTQLRPVLM